MGSALGVSLIVVFAASQVPEPAPATTDADVFVPVVQCCPAPNHECLAVTAEECLAMVAAARRIVEDNPRSARSASLHPKLGDHASVAMLVQVVSCEEVWLDTAETHRAGVFDRCWLRVHSSCQTGDDTLEVWWRREYATFSTSHLPIAEVGAWFRAVPSRARLDGRQFVSMAISTEEPACE